MYLKDRVLDELWPQLAREGPIVYDRLLLKLSASLSRWRESNPGPGVEASHNSDVVETHLLASVIRPCGLPRWMTATRSVPVTDTATPPGEPMTASCQAR